MDMDLTPKFPKTFFEGEGGAYYNWSSSESPVFGQAHVAAGKFVLKPQGFALPHYSDCSKIGYVLEGNNGGAEMILPKTKEENYVALKKGDVIPVPFGSVSWWYNHGDSDLVIVFLGDSSNAYVPGDMTYFLLVGAQGILPAFSPKFIGQTYHINAETAQKVAGSQKEVLILKLSQDKARSIPQPNNNTRWSQHIDSAIPDVQVKNGGISTTLTVDGFPFLEQVGVTPNILKLEPNAIRAPMYNVDGASQVFYVAKGSCTVQIVGLNGKRVLDTKVQSGQAFVVPRLFMVSLLADGDGVECFSVTTSKRPVVGELAGKNSVLNIGTPVLQVCLDVNSEVAHFLRKTMETGQVIVPPALPRPCPISNSLNVWNQ